MATQDLSTIRGIGPVSARRLQASGRTTIAGLLRLTTLELASLLGFGEARAADILEAARALAGERKPASRSRRRVTTPEPAPGAASLPEAAVETETESVQEAKKETAKTPGKKSSAKKKKKKKKRTKTKKSVSSKNGKKKPSGSKSKKKNKKKKKKGTKKKRTGKKKK